MKLIYEGIDITKSVAINRCEHETFAENCADRVMVRFSDAAGKWNGWKPNRGDTIRIVEGAADTGTMFISEFITENGLFTIHASALPETCRENADRSWEDIRLFQIGRDIAARHGLTFKSYDIDDQLYPFIRQEGKTDVGFLNALCRAEGYALAVYDKQIIVYDEHARESTAATADITVGADGRFEYADRSVQAYGAIALVSGAFRGAFSDPNPLTNRTLRMQSPIACASSAEAQRYARGLLRQANKDAFSGSFRQRLAQGYAAASVLNLRTTKASGWNGKIFVTKTRSDYVRGEIKIFFRKPLEGY